MGAAGFASVERNLPGLEPDEDPIAQRLVEMLGESQAETELGRAERARDETQERLEQMQAERVGVGRIFHRHEHAALGVHIAGGERALAFWQTKVDRSEEALAAVVAERDAIAEQEMSASISAPDRRAFGTRERYPRP